MAPCTIILNIKQENECKNLHSLININTLKIFNITYLTITRHGY